MVAAVFVVKGVTDTTDVTYVVVTGTRELGDLLAEGERGATCAKSSQKRPELRRQVSKIQ